MKLSNLPPRVTDAMIPGNRPDDFDSMTIDDWCQEIARWRETKGFETSKHNMLEKLMLVVTEVAEAAEDVRYDRWKHFREEIADVTIRIFDIAGSLDFDLEFEIKRKMEINAKRPYKHGKNA